MHYTVSFANGTTEYFLNASYSQLLQNAPAAHSVIITDEHIQKHYGHLFTAYRTLIIEAGESAKSWETIQKLSVKLASFEAHKNTMLIGIGGGVVTDITGFLASIYMRGIPFAFVPTSLLAMVDAAIGGKNGVNIGLYKNMLGSITQAKFILFDPSFLDTLPKQEWSNAFAEIIKYACILDAPLLEELQRGNIASYKNDPKKINALVAQCVQHKNKIVLADEREKHLRKILNFGHTAGHAFETLYQLKHGAAVALGMIVALIASEQQLNLDRMVRTNFIALLAAYELPTQLHFDLEKVLQVLLHDKKRNTDSIDFILLQAPGNAIIKALSFSAIRAALKTFADEYSY